MATYTITLDERTASGKALKAYLQTLGLIFKAAPKAKELDVTKTASYREALDDVEHGRVYHADSVEDMFKQILG